MGANWITGEISLIPTNGIREFPAQFRPCRVCFPTSIPAGLAPGMARAGKRWDVALPLSVTPQGTPGPPGLAGGIKASIHSGPWDFPPRRDPRRSGLGRVRRGRAVPGMIWGIWGVWGALSPVMGSQGGL